MMRIAICDDEEAPRALLQSRLRAWSGGETLTIDEFPDGKALLFSCGDNIPYDIAFLDIQMGQRQDGLQIAAKLRRMSDDMEIAFITNFIDYALRGYEVRALRYLMKPVKQHDVDACLDAIQRRLGCRTTAMFWYKDDGREQRVPVDNIRYFEVFSHDIEMHTVDGEVHTFAQRIADLEAALPASFVRNHRSTLVNIRHVFAIKKDTIELDNACELPISRQRRDVVFEAFRKYRL